MHARPPNTLVGHSAYEFCTLLQLRKFPSYGQGSHDCSIPLRTCWWILSSNPFKCLSYLGTEFGSKLLSLSRGTSIRTWALSVMTVLLLVPFLLLTGSGSSFASLRQEQFLRFEMKIHFAFQASFKETVSLPLEPCRLLFWAPADFAEC